MTVYIPILVHADDVAAVAAIIREREQMRGGSSLDPIEVAPAGGSASGDAGGDMDGTATADQSERPVHLSLAALWSETDLARLAAGSTVTTERWSRAMDVCAEEPLRYLPTHEVAKRAGMSLNEWRDAPRKISKHLVAHYPNVPRHPDGWAFWPLYAGGLPEFPGEVCWAISPEMAERWKRVRGGQA